MRKERETANELAKRAGKALKDVRSISAITGKAWFLSPFACTVILLICSGIDLCGFMSLTKTITNELHKLKQSSHFLIPYMAVAGLLAAFEVAPVYMGYALCLKLHGLGKGESGERVWKYVLVFSTAAFALGVAGNLCFRFSALRAGETSPKIAILYSLVPVITSLINLTIGCLAFDPLYADVTRLSKKLARLRAQKCWWMAKKKEKEQEKTEYAERCEELKNAVDAENLAMLEALTKIAVKGKCREANRKKNAKRERNGRRSYFQ